MGQEAKTTQRNIGVDLLRLVSMFFVVSLHSLLTSESLKTESLHHPSIAWLFEIFCYGAVDIFALISGYVGFRSQPKKFSIKPVLKLWAQTVFYSIVIFTLVSFFAPRFIQSNDIFSALSPITHGSYWYLVAYTGVIFLAPIINAAVREFSPKQCRNAILITFGLFSFFSILSNDQFHLNAGYSVWWIAALYFIGAAMKKSNFLSSFNNRSCVFGILACTAITWIFKTFGQDFMIADLHFGTTTLISYLSPTIVFSSILYLKFFSSLNIKPKFAKIISWAAPCAFGVYILNVNQQIWRLYQEWLTYAFNAIASTPLAYGLLLGFTIAFFIVAILIEKIRRTLARYIFTPTKSSKNGSPS